MMLTVKFKILYRYENALATESKPIFARPPYWFAPERAQEVEKQISELLSLPMIDEEDTQKEAQRYVRRLNHDRKFIQNLSNIRGPLNQLDAGSITYTDLCKNAVAQAKRGLVKAPLLISARCSAA